MATLRLSNLYGPPNTITNRDSHILIKDSVFTNLNFYSQVNSLAITGPSKVEEYYTTGVIDDESFLMPLFVNVGIVLNVEDFGGRIEIVGCKFERNMHYIPGI